MEALMAAAGTQGPQDSQGSGGSSADAKRARAYATAQRVDAVLNNTSKTLEGLVERINREHKAQEDDPVSWRVGENAISELLHPVSPRLMCSLQLELIRRTLDNQMSALRYIDSEAMQLVAVAQDVATSLQTRAQRLVEESVGIREWRR